ncbi:MAG: TonB-dependent receptor [Chitinophagaceae bacterium]|nr:TonB-dependent receptor [Chitinophagaceae bacterium]
MKKTGFLVSLLFFCLQMLSYGQTALLKGKVLDEKNNPLEGVNISVKDIPGGTRTDDKGNFTLPVPADQTIKINFSSLNYQTKTLFKRLASGETANVSITLKATVIIMKDIRKRADKRRAEPGVIRIDPKLYDKMPSIVGGIEGQLKIFLSNNNELTSQYNVRGGNFDENLVYINDFEVYRPFLVRSGQQEGLSIINPELVSGVTFSTGGFQSKYGDKMSSVLDITYKRPTEFAGSVSLSMLGLGAHIEGTGIKKRLSYMVGLRQKSNQYLLQAQQTKGVYNPTFTDIQTFVSYQFNTDWQVDVFANYARNRFDFQPASSTQSFGLINRAFQLKTYYSGAETDKFDSRYGGISLINTPNEKTTLKLIACGFQTNESETYDIQGEYLLGEIETDLGKENFGEVKYAIGTGVVHNYARNYLNVNVANIGHKGSYDANRHFLQWGVNTEIVNISDKLNEWERRDSAGFSQPFSDSALYMAKSYKTTQDFVYSRYSAFLQDNIAFDSIGLVATGGVRVNYNALNKEFLVSPRLQLAWTPKWKRDVIIKGAAGIYSQPPFYREMRNLDGNVNFDVKAQKSFHAVLGLDYNFIAFKDRPFKFTTEWYYKNMWDLVPYEYDNVRIRYFGKNNAKGYAYGAEFRLYGDIVKDAESWISLGLMKTGEDVLDDQVTIKSKVNGSDSTTIYPGYIPRPTDSRVSFGLFFSDYLPRNKNFKLFLSGLSSTGLPFGPPDQNRYGDTLRIPSYKRVDVGFMALLLDGERKDRPRYSYFRNIKSMWLSLEVFNLLGIQNTISYLWIQDQSSSRVYAVPNRLTNRLLNLKLVTRF